MRLSTLVLSAALMTAPLFTADAKTFRWSNDGDVVSLDPYYTNNTFQLGFLGNIYEPLARRSKTLTLEPALATSWKQEEANRWRFVLRQGVTFHDGSAFTADDVVFSLGRAMAEGSDLRSKLLSIADVKAVDANTVDIITKSPNPLLPGDISSVYMMSKTWAEKNNAVKPTDIKKNEENFSTRNTNGTGPFVLKSREPDVKTVLTNNPNWWDKSEHNLTEVIFQPIKAANTRFSALATNEIDMVYTLPLQDVDRVKSDSSLKLYQGPEMRTIFLGFDQGRDELLYSNVKGKNPFKDVRVRKAVYQAIDMEAIRARVMRGAATPTGLMVAPTVNGFDADLNKRFPYDPEAAKKLLAEAGYPTGFEVTLDCPNDRYVNDEQICVSLVPMLKRAGITVKLNAMPKVNYFPKLAALDTSFYMLGWTPDTYDALNVLASIIGSRNDTGQGGYNYGRYSNKRIDELIGQIQSEIDPDKRKAMIQETFTIHRDEVGHVPLHQQALAWATRANVQLYQLADNTFNWRWVTVN